MHAERCLESMRLDIGDHARSIPQQAYLGAIDDVASPRGEDMGDDAETVELHRAPQP